MSQYLTEEEVKDIQGVMHYLNECRSILDYEVKLGDSNGDDLGTIKRSESGPYALHFPRVA